MQRNIIIKLSLLSILLISVTFIMAQSDQKQTELDNKVKAFLQSHPRRMSNMNVPASDGQLLYDIVLKNNYTRGLEIGTSTGHSTIWIAWAMAKTGGKVITIEINRERYEQALENFKEAGLSDYIDARLADAHELVPQLEGPFDFVFSDADKSWYENYFNAIDPKLETGGCYTTHNVSESGYYGANQDYLRFLRQQDNYRTRLNEEGSGVAISYKISQ